MSISKGRKKRREKREEKRKERRKEEREGIWKREDVSNPSLEIETRNCQGPGRSTPIK